MLSLQRYAVHLTRKYLISDATKGASIFSTSTYRHQSSSTVSEETVPSDVDVVIVGGGVIGCATLYHLAKLGVTNTVLLERDKITSGTTWHTAGLVWSLRPNDVEVEILTSSRNLMSSIEEETGVNPGFLNNGGLFIASNKTRLDEYKRLMTLGNALNVPSHVLSPNETKKMYPLMNTKDVYGTLYSPTDGTIDPAGYCTALTRGATNKGAKVYENCPVNSIDVQVDDFGTRRVHSVHTEKGSIRTDKVINCAGAWSPFLGAMVDVNVPLIAMRHAYIVTERIEGIQNMPNVRDHDASVYLKLQGDALCVGGYEPNPIFWEEVEKDFSFGLFDLDWDVFSFNINGAVNRVPVIEQTGVKSTVCGPESFTPDHKPLMGETDVRGFYLGCGFNSAGMMLSGGCAEELAKWVKNGHPDKDMFGYDIRRFYGKLTAHHEWVKERSHESYVKNYSLVFPHDQPLAGRRMRMDPLFGELAGRGCHYQEKLGWERPGWFTDTTVTPMTYDYYGSYGFDVNKKHEYKNKLEMDYNFDFPLHHATIGVECMTCRDMAAVFNMSYFGQYYLVGPDAKKAANWIFTNSMDKPPGSVIYTCMLHDNGGTAGDLTVNVIESGNGRPHHPKFEGDGYYLAIGGAAAQYASSHIQSIIQDMKFDCELLDHSNEMSLLSIQGPNSRSILQGITDSDLSDSALPFSTSKLVKIAGEECRILRLTFVGELGYELHLSNESALSVYQALSTVGKQFGLVDAGYRAIDSLSIEKGYRHWHADLRCDDTPLESLLGFTCKLKSSTPFKGREALEKQKEEGIKRRLVCFTMDQKVPIMGLETIYRNNQAVGFLRRADFGFALNTSIGYGYINDPENPEKVINKKYVEAGDYEIEHLGTRHPATYHLKSPFDPKNLRIKGDYSVVLPVHMGDDTIDQKSLHV